MSTLAIALSLIRRFRDMHPEVDLPRAVETINGFMADAGVNYMLQPIVGGAHPH